MFSPGLLERPAIRRATVTRLQKEMLSYCPAMGNSSKLMPGRTTILSRPCNKRQVPCRSGVSTKLRTCLFVRKTKMHQLQPLLKRLVSIFNLKNTKTFALPPKFDTTCTVHFCSFRVSTPSCGQGTCQGDRAAWGFVSCVMS